MAAAMPPFLEPSGCEREAGQCHLAGFTAWLRPLYRDTAVRATCRGRAARIDCQTRAFLHTGV